MASLVSRLRALALAGGVAVALVTAQTAVPATAAAATPDLSSRVISIAESHLGTPWRFGATGPYAFDCSGLVYSVFRQAGLLNVIGGSRMSADGYWNYFAARGQASPTNGQPGDLVVFGNGSHIGIYLGAGRVISALVYGVAYSTLSNTIPHWTTFLHTHLYGSYGTATLTSASLPVRHTDVWLNMRAGAGTSYRIYSVLRPWTPVVILGSARDAYGRTWDRVRLGNGSLGWVASWYLV